eukprot:COSAG01_NODE_3803_length_5680_cov_19.836230_5_plen_214_part_00
MLGGRRRRSIKAAGAAGRRDTSEWQCGRGAGCLMPDRARRGRGSGARRGSVGARSRSSSGRRSTRNNAGQKHFMPPPGSHGGRRAAAAAAGHHSARQQQPCSYTAGRPSIEEVLVRQGTGRRPGQLHRLLGQLLPSQALPGGWHGALAVCVLSAPQHSNRPRFGPPFHLLRHPPHNSGRYKVGGGSVDSHSQGVCGGGGWLAGSGRSAAARGQ